MWATFDFDGCQYLSQTRPPPPKSPAKGFDWHNITRVMIWHPIVDVGTMIDGLERKGDQVEVKIVRVEQRRTPSTGLPPVCDGAAAMKIDPPGSVAGPHSVVEEIEKSLIRRMGTDMFAPQDRPIPAIRLARIIKEAASEFREEGAGLGETDIEDVLDRIAARIAHPLRLGEHG